MSSEKPLAPVSLAAPIGEGHDGVIHGTDLHNAIHHNTDASVPVPVAANKAVSDHSSDGNTLANYDEKDGANNNTGLGVPANETNNAVGMKRSANSSMDHVAELGEGGRVSVTRGKEQFAALERRFSNLSQHSQDLQRTRTNRSTRSAAGFHKAEKVLSHQSSAPDPSDAEKGKAEEDEFDLAETLKSGQQKHEEAGLKTKQVGVVWEDLEVIGAGGLSIHIRNFSNAVMEQFMVGQQMLR